MELPSLKVLATGLMCTVDVYVSYSFIWVKKKIKLSSNYNNDIFLLFTVKNCGPLRNPVNGRVSHTGGTTYGKIAYYYCNTGYRLVGNSTRTCSSIGVWSGSAPRCQSMFSLHACAQWWWWSWQAFFLSIDLCRLQGYFIVCLNIQRMRLH